eukprot:TRINITY_DN3821_c0_g1_i1.p1 TRINITY_DN3821_c0_g1~~TRINITY_DN3821_c0_g1_i1.p1  ORF type:complete len:513 (-),score=41.17 TRINITY_DN3821_c0_g1_i1:915-2453(-)
MEWYGLDWFWGSTVEYFGEKEILVGRLVCRQWEKICSEFVDSVQITAENAAVEAFWDRICKFSNLCQIHLKDIVCTQKEKEMVLGMIKKSKRLWGLQIVDDIGQAWFEEMLEYPQLRRIELAPTSFSKPFYERLCGCASITELSLTNSIATETVIATIQALSSSLQKLTLCANESLDPKVMRAIAAPSNVLQDLRVASCPRLDKEFFEVMITGDDETKNLQLDSLTSLRLEFLPLKSNGLVALHEVINQGCIPASSIKHLHLRELAPAALACFDQFSRLESLSSNQEWKSFRKLTTFDCIKSGTLSELNFSYSQVTDTVLQLIGANLGSLRSLTLSSCNHITQVGLKLMFLNARICRDAIRQKASPQVADGYFALRNLNISGCNVGKTGLFSIFDTLHTSLHVLNISATKSGKIIFSEIAENFSNIEDLNVEGCKASVSDLNALLHSLRLQQTVCRLDISQIKKAKRMDSDLIFRQLRKFKRLESVVVSCKKCDEEYIRERFPVTRVKWARF